jgi:hypothetical protein
MYKQIPGFSKYEVNEAGDIYRVKHSIEQYAKCKKDGSRELHNITKCRRLCNPSKNKNTGYMQISIMGDDLKRCSMYVHRAVALAWIPNPDNLKEVDHLNRNKEQNNVSNLEWVSKAENMRRLYKKRFGGNNEE